MENVLSVTIIESKYMENRVGRGWGKMSQGSKAGHLPQVPKSRLLLPFLTLNRLGFSESSEARQAESKRKIFQDIF